MAEDLLRILGYKTLGSRMKRLGERLQAEAQAVIGNVDVEAGKVGHSPILAALDHAGPLSVGELAQALGQSQPGITRMVGKLKKAGLLTMLADDNDQRIRRVALSGQGAALVDNLKRNVWPAIDKAVAEICDGLSGSTLEQLEAIEDALGAVPLMRRVKIIQHPSMTPADEGQLDNPVWSAVSTRQMKMTVGDEKARRFPPDMSPLAGTVDMHPDTLNGLSGLLDPGNPDDMIGLLLPVEVALPQDLTSLLELPVVQMLYHGGEPAQSRAPQIEQLVAADAGEMLALAQRTRPGPFAARTPELGRFWGVRMDGRIVAMAGERLSMPGFTEVSGVCTHPDFLGRGLGSALVGHAVSQIIKTGDRPFLHVVATNEGAIRLYEKFCFKMRRKLKYVQLGRADFSLM